MSIKLNLKRIDDFEQLQIIDLGRLEQLDKIFLVKLFVGESPQTEHNSHYAQIWSKKSANAGNLKICMGTVICNQTSQFLFETLTQSKGSYQLLMKFMLLKSQLSSKISLGNYRIFQHTLWTISLCHFKQFSSDRS